jgi:hypothetical protein
MGITMSSKSIRLFHYAWIFAFLLWSVSAITADQRGDPSLIKFNEFIEKLERLSKEGREETCLIAMEKVRVGSKTETRMVIDDVNFRIFDEGFNRPGKPSEIKRSDGSSFTFMSPPSEHEVICPGEIVIFLGDVNVPIELSADVIYLLGKFKSPSYMFKTKKLCFLEGSIETYVPRNPVCSIIEIPYEGGGREDFIEYFRRVIDNLDVARSCQVMGDLLVQDEYSIR